MSEETMPADWVLIEAAKRCRWDSRTSLATLRDNYGYTSSFRALCDMIEKYEQPPVDPDVEAVKRVLGWHVDEWHFEQYPDALDKAVAQYKLERTK